MTIRGALAWIVLTSALLFTSQSLAQPIGIVAVGDSNTAGFGVGRDQAFPAQLERMLRAAGQDVQVWNAGSAEIPSTRCWPDWIVMFRTA
jgi:acyl-CoA thioesterase I